MKPSSFIILFGIFSLSLSVAGCGNRPRVGGTRDSGQSNLMDKTFAGQNACDPDGHPKPFIIEWDATDMSSFESFATNDVVVVRYEGCSLVVLDECRNESILGSQGSYRPPEFTSGSLETIDISNQGELHAKLPLGSASLGGRISGGETFHMEYYVAGKREATRDALYRDDLASNPGCDGATHFVHGYNLGAFALGSAAKLDTKVGGSVYGFGAGGSTSSTRSADKKGGDLAVCRSDTATEVAGCKAPIRLSLRKIRDGEDPDRTATKTPDTDASLNAAGLLQAKAEISGKAAARLGSAGEKMNAGDGKGCLTELDKVARLEPKFDSKDPKSGLAIIRAQCLMLAGKCKPGKTLLRKNLERGNQRPETIDDQVENWNRQYCRGQLSPRDKLLVANNALLAEANAKGAKAKVCDARWSEVQKLAPKVKPRDRDDTQVIRAKDLKMGKAAHRGCLERAGACGRVRKAWRADLFSTLDAAGKKYWNDNPAKLQEMFEGAHKRCAK